MKIDAPSQILNVTNTTSQYHRHQLRQKIYNVCQTNHQTPSTPTKTPGSPKKHQVRQTKHQVCEFVFQNIDLRCFVARQILSRIYALFWRTFYRPKKYGGVPKMTIIKYAYDQWSLLLLGRAGLLTYSLDTSGQMTIGL